MAYTNSQFPNPAKPATGPAEMFSFTFNPELTNLFWGLYKGRNETSRGVGGDGEEGQPIERAVIPFFIQPIAAASSGANVEQGQYYIFGYQLPIDADASLTKNILNVLRHSAVTTGIVILVGLGSYCTYYSLQKLRKLLTKDSSTTTASSSSWWPTLKVQKTNDELEPNFPKSTSCSATSVSQTSDSGNYSHDLEAMKLGLTLDLKNGTKVKGSGDSSEKNTYAGKKIKGHRLHEGEHFSPSPVLTNINRGNAFNSKKCAPRDGRVLVGGDEEYAFRGDDDEFQIEYFGPERSSSSSTLSDHSEDEMYPDPYKKLGGIPPPVPKIQSMISPSHSKAATVRRQLDFGDVSPIPSAGPAVPYHQHHHLPTLSASSSMSLSPSTPTTGDVTSPTVTVTTSTPQPPIG